MWYLKLKAMVTFFSILLGLVAVNGVLLLFSVNKTKREVNESKSYIIKNAENLKVKKAAKTLQSYKKAV